MEINFSLGFPKQVKIIEVGPRDGLQNEINIIHSNIKIAFINQLAETGLKEIEVTSFVSPKWIPQLSDHLEVFKTINKNPNIHYSVLIPNLLGLENALSVDIKNIAVIATPSELFSQKNTNCSVSQNLKRIEAILALAKRHKIRVRAYISCVFDCPYEGKIHAKKVLSLGQALLSLGCDEISLGDTIGTGTPLKVHSLLNILLPHIHPNKIAVHFHDTYGQALVNIYAALQHGIAIFDSSAAGLGGCPYAKGAAGNVATEDVIYLLNGMKIETGVNLTKIAAAGSFIMKALNRTSLSKTHLAYQTSE